ncbi:MAG: ABC transporter permease [Rhodobacteraceae bacterium]|jgi:simple sugar transport system permease protein|nr:ABC transporter permease [Paracoccaceae bacterium]
MSGLAGIDPIAVAAALIVASTPILLAAIGELVAERAGVLNLGVEGMMILGAVVGFAAAVATGDVWLGLLAAAAGGAALAALFALLVLGLLANQVATGLALTMFGLGLSALIGQGYIGVRPPPAGRLDLPGLTDLPVAGRLLFAHDVLVYAGLALVAGVWAFLRYTRAGLILRAVGESHDAAHALGFGVRRVRAAAVVFGGACAGLGGAHLSLVRVPQWTEGMTAGAGWIALALVVFASWRPWRVLLGAWLFGGIAVLQLNLQAAGVKIPVEYLAMSPYVVTIVVLVIISADRTRAALNAPAALGRPFHAAG